MNIALIAAGFSNIAGVLVFSKFFTNPYIPVAAPSVMSSFGLLMIIVWGLAYIACVKIPGPLTPILIVFAIEKLIYGITWLLWHSRNDLGPLLELDALAGSFLAIYGVNDFFFMLIFSWFAFSPKKPNRGLE